MADHELVLLIWATNMPMDFPIYAAKAVQVLCSLKISESTPEYPMSYTIYLAKVCKVIHLYDLIK